MVYSDEHVDRLNRIVTLQKLGFGLEEIGEMPEHPDFDFDRVFSDRISALQEEKDTAESMIGLAKTIRLTGVIPQELGVFQDGTAEENAEKAAERFQVDKAVDAKSDRLRNMPYSFAAESERVMHELADCMEEGADSPDVQAMIAWLYKGMNEHIAPFPPELFAMMIPILTSGGGYSRQLDAMGKPGFSEFFAEAIGIFAASQQKEEPDDAKQRHTVLPDGMSELSGGDSC